MASFFDSNGHLALMFSAISGLATRTNFAIFVDVTAQQIVILVIDLLGFIVTEGASTGARVEISPIGTTASGTTPTFRVR